MSDGRGHVSSARHFVAVDLIPLYRLWHDARTDDSLTQGLPNRIVLSSEFTGFSNFFPEKKFTK